MQTDKLTVASLAGVTKKYDAITALNDVSLNVRAGELLALLGPNGAGKTTSVRLLLGLSKPGTGSVKVFGRDPRDASARGRVGAMLQVAKVPETLKVREHINLFRSYYSTPLSLESTLEAAGLEGMENRMFGALSGGQKQRVLFALAICGNPDLLFLDEPTVGLDIGTRHLIWQQIRRLIQRGRTVVLTTHYLEEVDALADRVVVLNHGVIVAEGTSTEIKAPDGAKKNPVCDDFASRRDRIDGTGEQCRRARRQNGDTYIAGGTSVAGTFSSRPKLIRIGSLQQHIGRSVSKDR